MKITPLEIRQKTFEKVFRGYEKDEVNGYLQSLSMEWERMLDENKELYLRIESLETESNKLRELESSLFKTLKTAEDTGATLIEQTKKETDLKIKESSFKAETIINDARSKAKYLVEQADERKKQVLDEMITKVKTLENLFNQMVDLKEKVVDQVKSYSSDLLERIEKLEKRSEELQIKDIVSEAKHIYNSTSVGVTLDFLSNGQMAEEATSAGDVAKTPDPAESKETFGGKEEIKMEVKVSTEKETKTFVSEKEGDVKDEPETLQDDIDVKEKDQEKIDSGSNTVNEGEEEQDIVEGQDGMDKHETVNEKETVGKQETVEEQPDIGFEESEKEKKSTSTSFFDEID